MRRDVSIRTFRFPQDYPAVRSLWEQMEKGIGLGRSDTLEEIGKMVTRDPDLFLVAESAGELVGTVIGGYDGRRGLVYHLAVAPTFRKQRLATRLMDEVESRLHQKGCLKCYLLLLDGNDEAACFYEKRGWSPLSHVHLFGKELS